MTLLALTLDLAAARETLRLARLDYFRLAYTRGGQRAAPSPQLQAASDCLSAARERVGQLAAALECYPEEQQP
jgi:hypothetical protein